MGDEGGAFGCCISIAFAGMIVWTVFICQFMYKVIDDHEAYSMSSFTQSQVDFTWPFIRDIYAVEKDEGCNARDEIVLHMPWYGARNLCIDDEDYYLEDCYTSGETGDESTYEDIQGFPMI